MVYRHEIVMNIWVSSELFASSTAQVKHAVEVHRTSLWEYVSFEANGFACGL